MENKKLLIFALAFILVGSVAALSFSSFDFKADSTTTTISTSGSCSKFGKCDGDTPSEITMDLEKDSKTGFTKIEYGGVLKSGK